MPEAAEARVRPATVWIYASAACLAALAGALAASKLAAQALAKLDPRFGHSFAAARLLWPPYVHHVESGFAFSTILVATVGVTALLALRACSAARTLGWSPAAIIMMQAAVFTALSACAFTLSGDTYLFILWGRIYGVDGSNPYLFSAPASVTDPVVAKILAARAYPPNPDDYGPLWTLMEGLIARAEIALPIAAQVWTHRALTIAAALVATTGIGRILRDTAAPVKLQRLALFAFNPLMMYECAVEGHNDILIVALSIWAFAIVDELPLIAGLLLGAAVSVKFVPIVIAPFLLVRIWRRNGWAMMGGAALAAAALVILPLRAFWVGQQSLEALHQRLGVVAGSPLWLANFALARAMGANRLTWLVFAAGALVVIVTGYALVRYLRTQRSDELWRVITTAVWATPGLEPEIFLWITPASALGTQRRWRRYAWWVATFALGYYVLFVTKPPPAFSIPVADTAAFLIALIVVPIAIAFWPYRRRLANDQAPA